MQSISLKQTFSAFRHYNYRLWFFGQLFSLIGTWMQSTAQGFLVYSLTGSAAYLGIVSFAAGIPTWLFTLFGGVAADRISRRKLLMITQTSMLILAVILAALVFTHVIQPWMIILLAFLLGIANAFDGPARMAFVVELVDDRNDMTNAIALNSSMFNLATVVGPAVAGFTYAWFGPAWCFLLNGISFIAVVIALAFMRIKPTVFAERKTKTFFEIKESIKYVYANKIILVLIASMGVVSVFGFGMLTLAPVWAVTILHGDATTNGFLLSARGLGALIGALTVAALGAQGIRGKMWNLGSFLLPVLLIIFALSPWLAAALLLLVGIGFGLMLMANNTNALIQTSIPDEMRGRVMAVYTMVFMGGMPIGSLILGALASIIPPQAAVLISGVILLAFAVFTWLANPQIRQLS
jgi:MFS family permease